MDAIVPFPERDLVADILRQGLHKRKDQWRAARIGLARSLQIAEAPSADLYKVLGQQQDGVILHSDQLTGEGNEGPDDFTDVYRALLSTGCGGVSARSDLRLVGATTQ